MSGAIHLIHCLRPLHNGAGEGLGAIDRPIVREGHTGFPYVQSSSIKGTARAAAQRARWTEADLDICFGPEKAGGKAGKHKGSQTFDISEGRQGALAITDAMLLLFPVRSDAATWVWTSSPLALARLARWCELAGDTSLRPVVEGALAYASLLGPANEHALCGEDDSAVRLSSTGPYSCADDALVPVEDRAAQQAMSRLASALSAYLFPTPIGASDSGGHHHYWRTFFASRLLLVSDGRLTDLTLRCSVVEPGIEIDDKSGTTTTGSLRYTEFLPEESVLFTHVAADPALSGHHGPSHWTTRFGELMATPWQVGGDESKGKGLVRSVAVTGGGSAIEA